MAPHSKKKQVDTPLTFVSAVQKYFGFGKYSKWQKGNLRILIGRPSNETRYAKKYPDKMALVEQALEHFCESMDIPLSQKYFIQPDELIMDIYREVRISESTDDLEIERLFLAVEDELKIDPQKHLDKDSTVLDWVSMWVKNGKAKDVG